MNKPGSGITPAAAAAGATVVTASTLGHNSDDIDDISTALEPSLRAHGCGCDLRESFLLQIGICRGCKGKVVDCQIAHNYSPGLVLIMSCGQEGVKRCKQWYACLSCEVRVDARRIQDHFGSPKHATNVKNKLGATVTVGPQLSPIGERALGQPQDIHGSAHASAVDDEIIDDFDNDGFIIADEGLMVIDDFSNKESDHDELMGAEDESELLVPVPPPEVEMTIVNENLLNWLEATFSGTPKAGKVDMLNCLSEAGSPNMLLFWGAQHFDGGLQYLVARTFTRSLAPPKETFPSLEEAKWHVKSFIQFISHSQKQKRRQAEISHLHMTMMGGIGSYSSKTLLCAHRVLNYRDTNRCYGKTSQHSLCQSLPIPRVRNIGGIAYVSPVDLCRFLFSVGCDMDDITINACSQDERSTETSVQLVLDVEDSRAVKAMRREASSCALMNKVKHSLILVWSVDWRDGFGANRAKSVRKSMVA